MPHLQSNLRSEFSVMSNGFPPAHGHSIHFDRVSVNFNQFQSNLYRANGRGGFGSQTAADLLWCSRRNPEKQTVGTVTASQKVLSLQALSSSLNAGTGKGGGCLGRGEAFGCPPAVCPPERPRPFTQCRSNSVSFNQFQSISISFSRFDSVKGRNLLTTGRWQETARKTVSSRMRLFYLRWGNRMQKRPNPISRRGEP